MKSLLYLFIFSIILLIGCSKKDDPVSTQTNDALITGKWQMEFSITSLNTYDSLGLKLNVAGNDGTFSGTGDFSYLKREGSTSTRNTFTDDAKGTYSESELKITLKSSISGNTFTFTGTRETSALFLLKNNSSTTKYIGTVNLLLDGKTTEFTNISIFKSL